ncbi:MAG TPA: hypothetical protein VGH23_18450 [Rhizomicrobium sp.]|jgi:hypothetical protein
MFVEGTSWRKRLAGGVVVYLIFLALGLAYASRIFHEPAILYDALIVGLVVIVPLIVWAKYKTRIDPAFAARAAQRKANPDPDAKRNASFAPLYILLFHFLFLVLVLTIKHVLDGIAVFAASGRANEIIFATAAATALAGLAVMSLAGFNDRRRKSRAAAQA